jgi:hypothetical protein
MGKKILSAKCPEVVERPGILLKVTYDSTDKISK